MSLPTLTALDASRLLNAWAAEWAGAEWDKAALVAACTDRHETTVERALDLWLATHPGRAPDPTWITARIDKVDRSDEITAARQAARNALRRPTR